MAYPLESMYRSLAMEQCDGLNKRQRFSKTGKDTSERGY